MSIACCQNNGSNCTLSHPEFFNILWWSLYRFLFSYVFNYRSLFSSRLLYSFTSCCLRIYRKEKQKQLIEPKKQSDNVTSMLQRGPVFQSKSSEENDSSCFHFLQNFEMLGVLEVYDSYNGKKDRLFSKEPLFPCDRVS